MYEKIEYNKFLILLAMAFCVYGASAQVSNDAINFHNKENIDFLSLEWSNVSSKFYSPEQNFTNVEIGFKFINKTDLFIVQEGDRFSNKYFASNSFYKDSTKIFLGGASYSNSIRYNNKWNTASDYNLFYPYVMADTIGGDSYKENYAFNGGYAFLYNKFIIGIEASYNASLEYRRLDPRPLNTCSDLYFALNTVYSINSFRRLSLSVSYRAYQQRNNSNLFNSSSESIMFYQRGFGLNSEYFSKKSSRFENLYDLYQYSAQLSYTPVKLKSLYLISSYTRSNMDFMLDTNNKSIASMKTNRFVNSIAYKFIASKISLGLFSDIDLSKGFEYNYKVTGVFFNENNKYNRQIYSSVFSIMYKDKKISTSNMFNLDFQYRSFNSEYKKDNSTQNIDKLIVSAGTSLLFMMKKKSLICKLNIKHANTISKKLNVPKNITKAAEAMLSNNHSFMSEDYVETRLSTLINFPLRKSKSVFTKLSFTHINFINYKDNYVASMAIGLSF